MTLVTPPIRDLPVPETDFLFKEARRRRRRRRLGWTLVILAVIAATVAALSQLVPKGGAPRPPNAKTGSVLPVGSPKEIVGWTSTARVVVVSTATGHVERTLASNVSILAPGLPSVSVSPDGTVFFESAETASYNNDVDTGDQILSVPITGGAVRDIASGSDPQVSPNGRLLAFISPDPPGQPGEAPYLVPPVGIDIATISDDGALSNVRTLNPGPLQLNQAASDLSWSSDSEHLSFDLLQPSTNVTTSWTIPVSRGITSLASARQIQLHQSGLTWNGYWGVGRDGAPVGLGILATGTGRQEVVTINPSTGRVANRLFSTSAEICTDGPAGCSSDFSNSVVGDTAGTSVLVAGAIPLVVGTPTPSGDSLLYRWSVGNRAPVSLAHRILVATWGPLTRS